MENIQLLQQYNSDNAETNTALIKLREKTKNFTIIPDSVKENITELIVLIENNDLRTPNKDEINEAIEVLKMVATNENQDDVNEAIEVLEMLLV